MSDVAEAYESLDRQSQMEVEQLVFRLVEKQKQSQKETQRTHEENVALLNSLMGTTHVWDGVDVLEYQRKLRGEYRERL